MIMSWSRSAAASELLHKIQALRICTGPCATACATSALTEPATSSATPHTDDALRSAAAPRRAIDATAATTERHVRTSRKTTTTRTNARIFVRARASESPRRGRTARQEPAHALVWFCSRHLHARIMLCVGTFIQGVLPGYRFWGHHETSRTGHVRSIKTRRNFKSHSSDL